MLARAGLAAFAGLLPLSCLDVPPPEGADDSTGSATAVHDDGGPGSPGDTASPDDGSYDGWDDGQHFDLGSADTTIGTDSGSSSDSGTTAGDSTDTGTSTGEGSSGTSDGTSSTTG